MKLTVTSSPHIRGDFRTSTIMLDVVIALIPSLIVGAFVLGFRALLVALVSVAAAVATEVLYSTILKKRLTVIDGSAMVTGLLLAMTLPVNIPLWLAAAGSAFAILAAKLMWGGLGQNIFNPALLARALMMLLFPAALTNYASGVDAVSSATPLHHMVMPALPEQSIWDMFIGNCPGSIGELSALALIAGGVYLLRRNVISRRIPLGCIGTVAILTLVFHKTDDALSLDAVSALLRRSDAGCLLYGHRLRHLSCYQARSVDLRHRLRCSYRDFPLFRSVPGGCHLCHPSDESVHLGH